jgi:transposase InsO family protein
LRVAKESSIDILKTPCRAPKADAIGERFMDSVRRECLDHLLVLGERHLHRVIKEYVEYFNHARPHQGIVQEIPQRMVEEEPGRGKIIAFPVLNGLHHDYRRAA